jgi:hypothetical protein
MKILDKVLCRSTWEEAASKKCAFIVDMLAIPIIIMHTMKMLL